MTTRPLCSDCVAFWARYATRHPDGEVEVKTIGRICPCGGRVWNDLDRVFDYQRQMAGDLPESVLMLARTNVVVQACVAAYRNRTMTALQALEAMVVELARQHAEHLRMLDKVEAMRPMVVKLMCSDPLHEKTLTPTKDPA